MTDPFAIDSPPADASAYHVRMEEVSRGKSNASSRSLRPQDAWIFGAGALIVVLDQLTKWIVTETIERGDARMDIGFFRLVHITNSGAAFGILGNAGPLLAITSVVGIAAIVIYIFNPGFAHPLMRAGLGLMLGGAIGNLIDRLRNGEVVDFLKVPNWPAFNIADSAITIGVILLLWTMLRETREPASAESS